MRRHIIILSALLVLSLIGNIQAIRLVKVASANLDRLTYTRSTARLVPGEPAPPIEVKTLDGTPTQIAAHDSPLPTVIYLIAPNCNWCDRNHESVSALIEGAGSRFRFVMLSVRRQDLAAYLESHPTTVPVFMEPDSASVATYGLLATPATFVISPAGRLDVAWMGAFNGSTKEEVEDFFDVTLPELPAPEVE